jgi:hypothetical protein
LRGISGILDGTDTAVVTLTLDVLIPADAQAKVITATLSSAIVVNAHAEVVVRAGATFRAVPGQRCTQKHHYQDGNDEKSSCFHVASSG